MHEDQLHIPLFLQVWASLNCSEICMHGADEEVSGNMNRELLRIDDDNDEYDNMSVDHMGHLFWAVFAGKIFWQRPNNCLSNVTKQHAVNERKVLKL